MNLASPDHAACGIFMLNSLTLTAARSTPVLEHRP